MPSFVIDDTKFPPGAVTVTVAEADFEGSALDVAVTITVVCVVTEDGAIYSPPAVIVPT